MLNLVKKLIFWIIRNILPLLIFPKQKIIFISVGPSGCNSYALYRSAKIVRELLYKTKKT